MRLEVAVGKWHASLTSWLEVCIEEWIVRLIYSSLGLAMVRGWDAGTTVLKQSFLQSSLRQD
jgi:hypothetical protein